jgi:hypothetical protein
MINSAPRGVSLEWCLRRLRGVAVSAMVFLIPPALAGAVLVEDFASMPAGRGWEQHGAADLFAWDAGAGLLRVTWDSSRTNSFFYKRLPFALSKTDDFALSFDFRLQHVAAGNQLSKPGPFQIALGLFNATQAVQPGFSRGNLQCSNLVEFDYFPSGTIPGWGVIDATVSPMMLSSDRQPASSMTFPLELPAQQWLRVSISFTASDRTLVTTVTREGVPIGSIKNTVLGSAFGDFRVDAVGVLCYSDAGDAYGSVLAHADLDNLTLTYPDPPAPPLIGGFDGQTWSVWFGSQTNWLYALEKSAELGMWQQASGWVPGDGGLLRIADTNTAGATAFYRLNLQRQ